MKGRSELKILLTVLFIGLGLTSKGQELDENLKKLVLKAYENSSQIKINAARIKQSAIDRQTAKFTYLPKITAGTTFTRLNDDIVFPDNFQNLLLGTQRLLVKEAVGVPFNSPLPSTIPLSPIDPIQEKNLFKITGNAQWVLFSGFKVENAIRATRSQENALLMLTEKEKNVLINEVSETYDKLALVIESHKVLQTSTRQLDEQRRFVEGAIKNGLATPLERQRVELARQKLALKFVEFDNNRTVLLQKLEQLTSLDTADIASMKVTLQPYIVNSDPTDSKPRPEILAIDEAIKATGYKSKMEMSEYIPKLAAFSQYEFRDNDLSMLDPKWYVGLRLQWNVFDGFTARNSARKVRLEQSILEEQKKDAQKLIELSRVKAFTDVTTAQQKLVLADAQVKLAAKTYDFVNKQYRNSLVNQTEVLSALTDLEKARLDQQQVFFEQRKAAIQFLQANGTLTEYF